MYQDVEDSIFSLQLFFFHRGRNH